MATIDEALAGWTSYAGELKTAKAASDAHAADLQSQLQALQDEYDEFVATDAETDAAQAAALESSIGDRIAAALDASKNPPVLPEPPVDVPETPAEPETPVAEEPEDFTPDPDEPTAPPVPFDPAPVTPVEETPVDVPVEDVPVEPVPGDGPAPDGEPVPSDTLDPAPADEPGTGGNQ